MLKWVASLKIISLRYPRWLETEDLGNSLNFCKTELTYPEKMGIIVVSSSKNCCTDSLRQCS